MTFDSRLCEDAFVTLGRGSTLRHAYRAYLWRRARGLIGHSLRAEAKAAVADFCAAIYPSMAPRSEFDTSRPPGME